MRAARVHELGTAPRLEEVEPPARSPGDAVLESDTTAPGTRAYVYGGGLGIARDGTLAERALVPEERLVAIDEEVAGELAVACGIAGVSGWLSVTRRARVGPGDRVVAAGRRPELLERAREAGADATVELDDREDLAGALKEACGGDGPTVVVDPLWGTPVVTALAAAAPGARIAHVGTSAGQEATLPSALVRGKQLDVLGYSTFGVPMDELREGYLELLGHAAAGRVRIPTETFPLERLAEAWERQAAGPGAKLVVELRPGS